MRFILPCVLLPPLLLLLLLSTFAAALDFQPGSGSLGQLVFSRRSRISEEVAAKVKRSLPAWLSSESRHRIQRRSAEAGASCRALQGFESKLMQNTHRVGDRATEPGSCYYSSRAGRSVWGGDVCSGKMKYRCCLSSRCSDRQARAITCRNGLGVSIAMESDSDHF